MNPRKVIYSSEPTVCPIDGAPLNCGSPSLGERVRCHADCGEGESSPFEGRILRIHAGFLAGWYGMSGYPAYSEVRVHRQELERCDASSPEMAIGAQRRIA